MTAGAGASTLPEAAAGGAVAGAGAVTAAAAAIDGDIAASSLIPLLANGVRIFGVVGSFTKADAQLLAIVTIVVEVGKDNRRGKPSKYSRDAAFENAKPYNGFR